MPQLQTASAFVPLHDIARPTLYRINAFRITGLDVDCSPAQVRTHAQKLEMAGRLGIASTSGASIFPLSPAPSLAHIQEAKQRLNDPQARALDELFWFWPRRGMASSADPALSALRKGDAVAARTLWEILATDPLDDFAVHNLAVLAHLQALDTELTVQRASAPTDEGQAFWVSSWKYWKMVVGHDPTWQRFTSHLAQLADPRLTSSTAEQVRKSLEAVLLQINVAVAVTAARAGNFARASMHSNVLRQSGVPATLSRKVLEEELRDVRSHIAVLCQEADTKCAASVGTIPETLKSLLQGSQPPRELLNYLLGAGDPVRDAAHDEITSTIRRNLVTYANEAKVRDLWLCRGLLNEALPLAASESARTRCQTDLDTVGDLIGNDIEAKLVERCEALQKLLTGLPRVSYPDFYIAAAISDLRPMLRNIDTVRAGGVSRDRVHDYAAHSIRNAIVDYGNATRNWSACYDLLTSCRSLASSSELLGKIDEDLAATARLSGRSPVSVKTPKAPTSYQPGAAAGAGKSSSPGVVITWVLIALFVFIVLAKSCQSILESDSQQPARPNPAAAAGPTTPQAKAPSPDSAAPTASPAYSDAYTAALKSEIEANRLELRRLGAEADRCNSALAYYKGLIDQDRSRLEAMKAQDNSGVEVDASEYERIRARHNANVGVYNTTLESCQATESQHDELLNSTNTKIDEYNRIMRSR